ncbi:MAG: hypothetical protein WCA80_11760 [Candidatus Aquilonibacter sp.]
MLGLLLWSYSLTLGTMPSARIASVSLARNEVIVATASGLTAIDQRDGRVRWVRAGAALPADSYHGLIVASTSRGIEALNVDGSLLWSRDVCQGHGPPLILITSGRRVVAACSYNQGDEVLVRLVLLNDSGTVLSSRTEGAFISNVPFRVLRINGHLFAIGQVFSGAMMQFATTVIDVDTDAEIDSDQAIQQLMIQRQKRAARLGILCRSGGSMADVLSTPTLTFAVCGGYGNPLTIEAYHL